MRWTPPHDEWTAATVDNETGERWVYFFDDLEELRWVLLRQIVDEVITDEAATAVMEAAEFTVKAGRMEELLFELKNIPLGCYWYAATPYSRYEGGIEVAFVQACKAAAFLIRNGVRVFSPICHTHPIALNGDIDPLSHDIWMPADEPLMEQAHGLVVVLMPGWDESRGVRQEIETFKQAMKPIYYLPWEDIA